MKAGVCTIADKNRSSIQMIDLTADAGAEGVEIWAQPDHVRYPFDDGQLREIRAHADRRGLDICAIGSYLGRLESLLATKK